MKQQMQLEKIRRETCVVRETHLKKGRTNAVSPGATASRNLYYGRIRIEAGDAHIEFENADHETGLICLNGSAVVTAGDDTFNLGRYDALYIPRDSTINVESGDGCDIAEISAPVEKQYPLQYVSFSEIRNDPSLHFTAGKPPTERDLNILLGANVECGRIMAGVTFFGRKLDVVSASRTFGIA